MAAEISGMPSSIVRVRRVRVLVSVGRTARLPGQQHVVERDACRISMLPPQVKVAATIHMDTAKGRTLARG